MQDPRSTLRRVYTTLRGATSVFALTTIQKFLSFEQPKTKRRNAFQYVVLHPSAPSSSDDITAKQADAAAKIQKDF